MDLIAHVNIAGQEFQIITDKFATPAEAAKFFVGTSHFFITHLTDEEGNTL